MLKPRKLTQETLAMLIECGSVRECIAAKHEGRWALLVRSGTQRMTLGSQRLDQRLWGSLDTLSDFAAGLGIRNLQVEL